MRNGLLNGAKREVRDENVELQYRKWIEGGIKDADVCCQVRSQESQIQGTFLTQKRGNSLSVFYRSGEEWGESLRTGSSRTRNTPNHLSRASLLNLNVVVDPAPAFTRHRDKPYPKPASTGRTATCRRRWRGGRRRPPRPPHRFSTDREERARLGQYARAAASRLPGNAGLTLDAGIVSREDQSWLNNKISDFRCRKRDVLEREVVVFSGQDGDTRLHCKIKREALVRSAVISLRSSGKPFLPLCVP